MGGRQRRRPASSARLFFRPKVSIGNALTLDFDFLLSTEGSSARQDINQFDFNPKWSWGEAHAGDFYQEYSPLSLNGVRIRGGAIDLRPGGWQASFFYGRTQRAVDSRDRSRSYERTVSGGRLGVGSQNGSGFILNVFAAKDRIASLTTPDSVLADPEDSSEAIDPESVTPNENLVVTGIAKLVLFDRKLNVRSEAGVSAFTRDRRSSTLDVDGVPDILTNIFTPRLSSNADYAVTAEADLDLRKVGFSAGFEYIGPGYMSLGVASLVPDRQSFSIGSRYRLSRGLAKLDFTHQTDNLADQKRFTTARDRITFVWSYRVLTAWQTNTVVNYSTMDNGATDSTALVDRRNWTLQSNHQVSFRRVAGLKRVALTYAFQSGTDGNEARASSNVRTHSASVRVGIGISRAAESWASAMFVVSKLGSGNWNVTRKYEIGVRTAAMRRKLTIDGSLGLSHAADSRSPRAKVGATYKVMENLQARLQLDGSTFRTDSGENEFDELTASLAITRRF